MEGAFANTAKPLESTVGESTSETYGIIELLIWSILDSNLRVLPRILELQDVRKTLGKAPHGNDRILNP